MNKPKPPSLIPLLVLTLITVIMWVSFDVYRAFQKPAEIHVPESVSNPLTPTLDQAVIGQIESRIFLDSSQIPDDIVTSTSITPIFPTPSPAAEEASGSGTTP